MIAHKVAAKPPELDELGACRGEGTDLFFPIGSSSAEAQEQTREAKAFCRRCDVRAVCLTWALETRQDAGIWGGLTEDERHELRREKFRAQRRAAARRLKASRRKANA